MTELIERFYGALAKGDAETMLSCYHDDVVFTDPAFGQLTSDEARTMWRMLVEEGRGNLHVSFSSVAAASEEGSAHWRAEYVFSPTGRKIVNGIDARFIFREGKIIEHVDSFDLKRWAAQAFGLPGRVLGGTRLFRHLLHTVTRSALRRHEHQHRTLNPG